MRNRQPGKQIQRAGAADMPRLMPLACVLSTDTRLLARALQHSEQQTGEQPDMETTTTTETPSTAPAPLGYAVRLTEGLWLGRQSTSAPYSPQRWAFASIFPTTDAAQAAADQQRRGWGTQPTSIEPVYSTGTGTPEPDIRRLIAPVREMRLVAVPLVPDTARWTPAEQAEAARGLALQLAEHLSTYGSSVVLDALSIAYMTDLQDAANVAGRRKLAATYWSTATMLQGMRQHLAETEAQS